jgi:hypothetical protein
VIRLSRACTLRDVSFLAVFSMLLIGLVERDVLAGVPRERFIDGLP